MVRRPPPALLALAGFVALAAALPAGPVGAARRRRAAAPANPLAGIPRPNPLAWIAHELEDLGYAPTRVNEAAGWVLARVRGEHGVYSLYLVPDRELLHLRVPRLARVAAGDPGVPSLLARLAELNWLNLVGKYAWDRRDGEVRFAYSMVVPDGPSPTELALAVSMVLRTVDEDMPALRDLGRVPPAPAPGGP